MRWTSLYLLLGLILLAAGFSPFAVAQQQGSQQGDRWRNFTDPVFHNLSVDQGLPSGRVSGVAVDDQGFAWLVTSDGLARWDGVSLSPLTTGKADVDSDIRVLKAGPGKQLWMGTGSALRCFNPGTGLWREFSLLAGQRFPVTAIAFDQRGDDLTVWVGTERGVFAVDAASGKATRYLEQQAQDDVTLRVFALLLATDGSIWAGTSIGLFRKLPDSANFAAHSLSEILPAPERIATLVEASTGDIWIGTPMAGVFALAPNLEVREIPIDDFSGEWIFSMAQVSANKMWLGSYGRGLIELDLTTGATQRMSHLPLLKHSVIDDEIWTILPSPSGLVWIGTSRGCSVHDLNQRAIQTAFGASGRANALRDRGITSLLELSDGRLLAGLQSSGVDIIDPARGRVGAIEVNAQDREGSLPGGAVEAMAQMADGSVWIGSNWGLYRLVNMRVERQRFDLRGAEVFTSSLLADDGTLWAGGSDGLWRLRFSPEGNRSEQIAPSVSGGFTDPRITTLAKAAGGEVVVGTWNGVTWVDNVGQVSHRIPDSNATKSPLDNGYVTSVLTDSQGRTWIGTSGAGIYVRLNDGSLRHLSRSQGLPSDLTGGLLADSQGRIWASSNGGLAVINPDDLSIQALGPEAGVMVTPYFRQPALVTREGELLFGGDGGVTIVAPERWQPRTVQTPLAVSTVTVGEKPLVAAAAGTSDDAPIVVPANHNALRVDFAALDYLAARSLRYRHKLVGFDDGWKITNASSRSAIYNSLPPGSYELQIQSSNRQGQWSENTQSRFLQVMPLWYQTHKIRWLAALLAVGFVMALLRWRTGQLTQRQLELEALVEQRTAELKQAAQSLEEKSLALETASLTDPLTGMKNRRFVEQHLPTDQSLCFRDYRDAGGLPREGADLLLFMVDIDHFKAVNDQHGHGAGDAVLAAMPDRLLGVFRESDYLVRWGGEEFLVVARSASRAHVQSLARRIANQISATPFDTEHTEPLNLTCSIGYCPLPFDPRFPDALGWQDAVRLADMALYAAKRSGRNAWAGIQAGAELGGVSDVRYWLTQPRAALLDGQIELTCSKPNVDIGKIWSDEKPRRR